MAATTTIGGLPAVTSGNLTGAAVMEVEDATSTSVHSSLAQLRTNLLAGGPGFTATDPLVAGAMTSSGATVVTYPVLPAEGVTVTNTIYPYGDIRRYGAVCDGSHDDFTAIGAASTSAGTYGDVIFPPNTTVAHSGTLQPLTGQTWYFNGSTLKYTGVAKAVSVVNPYVTFQRPQLTRSGAAATSVGLAVGDVATSAHHFLCFGGSATGFYNNVVVQFSFYGGYFGIDSYAALNANWYITNEANSNDFFDCRGRGTQVSNYGVLIDDTTNNLSGIRWFGGTCEGNVIQNMDIRGADKCNIVGPHFEANAATALTGTVTFTNGSTAVTGSGTLFTAQILVGQYIRLATDASPAWYRVSAIADNTHLTITETYQGAGAPGTTFCAGGDLRIANGVGTALRNQVMNCEFAANTNLAPGIYLQGGQYTQIIAADIETGVVIGASSDYAQVMSPVLSGGIIDIGTNTTCFADAVNSRYYIKNGTTKSFDWVAGGSVSGLKTSKPLGVTGGNYCQAVASIGGTATATGTFGIAMPDTGYVAVVTPVSSTGTPAAGSNRVISVAKSTTGVVITLEAPPGAGNTVTFDVIAFYKM